MTGTVRYNPFTGMRYIVMPEAAPLPPGKDEGCPSCDDTGRVYNNADTASGQWVPCECPSGWQYGRYR